MSKPSAGHCLAGAEKTVRRYDFYIQRNTSHILVLTVGEDAIMIDADGFFF